MDWVVTIIGVIAFYLAGQKVWWAWYVNIANQVLWAIFAVVTEQWGFLIGTPLYMSVFMKNAYDWTKEHRTKKRIAAKLSEPIGEITLLEIRDEGLFAQGVLFDDKKE